MEVFGSDKNSPRFICQLCDLECIGQTEYMNHMSKHKLASVTNGSIGRNLATNMTFKDYVCDKCNYKCSKKSDFQKHLLTRKHLSRQKDEKKVAKVAKKSPQETNVYECPCGKVFKTHGGLWKHKQRCAGESCIVVPENNTIISKEPADASDKETIMMLVKQNQEFKDLIITQNNQIVEMSKEVAKGNVSNHYTQGNNNITQTNSNNKTFNLQFFLNETCKDAMNITDFIKSLQLNLQDLEQVGELGYAEGISRMFVRGLNELDVTKRPIHCSDLKREVLHIKDKDKWEKDNQNQDKLKKAIKDLSNKNIMLFDDWQKKNPGYDQYDNKKNDIYLKMMVQAMGPADDVAERRDFGKIIKSIAKTTIVRKGDIE
tara:strand:+ start:1351 stop:2469 length:1119 start_codon:yes stop_codon:yes gene_type:complete